MAYSVNFHCIKLLLILFLVNACVITHKNDLTFYDREIDTKGKFKISGYYSYEFIDTIQGKEEVIRTKNNISAIFFYKDGTFIECNNINNSYWKEYYQQKSSKYNILGRGVYRIIGDTLKMQKYIRTGTSFFSGINIIKEYSAFLFNDTTF